MFRRFFTSNFKYRGLRDSNPDTPADDDGSEAQGSPLSPLPPTDLPRPRKVKQKLPFRQIWTRNVITTLLSHALLSMGIGTFQNLWFIFLSAPRTNSDHDMTRLPFYFTGGLGLPSSQVGAALAILGAIGINLQIFVYPIVSHRLGTLRSYRFAILLFPLVYIVTPYLTLVPSTSKAPAPASGAAVWAAMTAILAVMVLGRTFALPANIILVNNCSPHPTVLGTIHGIAQSVSSLVRTIGPLAGAYLFGVGFDVNVVGIPFWTLACVAALGVLVSGWVNEGDGHEILLEGETRHDGRRPSEYRRRDIPANGVYKDEDDDVEVAQASVSTGQSSRDRVRETDRAS